MTDDWEPIIEETKKKVDRCEVCGKNLADKKYARRLMYDKPAEENLVILCSDCNYRFHLAEEQERKDLAALNEQFISDIKEIAHIYILKRDNIVSDAIIHAVETNRTSRRPKIDMLYKYPTFQEDDKKSNEIKIVNMCRDLGYFDGKSHEKLTKLKIEALRAQGQQPSQNPTQQISEPLDELPF